MCVCVFWRSLCLKFFRLRDFCVDWIINWVVCWIAFIFVLFSSRKTILKSWLDTCSTPSWYLTICRASQAFFLMQSRHLLDTWWIDRAFVLESYSLLLDTCSIPQLSKTNSLTPTLTSRYLSCRALLKGLYILPSRSFSHFFDLYRSIRACSSPKHSLFHFQPLPQGFFKLFQVFQHLVSV